MPGFSGTGENGRWSWYDVCGLALLFLATIGYSGIGAFSCLEPTDEGLVVYSSWRVARGALPYRDIQQIYGPGVFFLNGGLFAVFGDDLEIIRWSLVLLRGVLGVCVYKLARRVASQPASLLVWALFVAVWGSPLWVFNSPYANHYGLTLSMLALLVLLSRGSRGSSVNFAVAGALIGIAALFKQTLGAFYASAVILALVNSRHRRFPYPPMAESATMRSISCATVVLILAAIGGLVVAYVWQGRDHWSTLILVAPILSAVALFAKREVAAHANAQFSDLRALFIFGLSNMIPLAVCIVFYWHAGVLTQIAHDTVFGLPQLVVWFVPLPTPDIRVGLHAVLVVCFLGLANGLAAAPSGRAAWKAARWWALVLTIAAAMTVYTASSSGGWIGDVTKVLWWSPAVFVCGLLRQGLRTASKGKTRSAQELDFSFIWLFAAAGVLQLYPAADLAHVGMILPGILPLVANAIDRLATSSFPNRTFTRRFPQVATSCVALLAAAPFLYAQRSIADQRPHEIVGFARASHIWSPGTQFNHTVELIAMLEREPREVFLLAHQPMLYFLSAHESLFDAYEQTLYLIATGLIAESEARKLIPVRQIVNTLATARPVIIDDTTSPAGTRFRKTFPRVAEYIDAHYSIAEEFGKYRVWRPNSEIR